MSVFKKIVVSSFLALILLASNWALLSPNFFRVHDYTHSARISQMTLALSEGHFPVRWVKDFGYGYGMPLFEFYAPLPYYFGSLLYWLGFEMIFVLKSLFFVSTFMTMLGAFLLGRRLFGSWGGLITASAITLAPYRAVNLFVRGAVSESWAIMFLPWILYGIVLVIDDLAVSKKKILFQKPWLILVFSLVGLFLSHNLTTLMFLPISFLFAFLYFVYKNKVFSLKIKEFLSLGVKSALSLGLGYILAIGLASFYLIPAFIEKGFTKVESFVLGGYFDYGLHFVYIRQFFNSEWGFGGSSWGVDDDISFFLGYGQLILLVLVVVGLVKIIFSYRKKIGKLFATKIFVIGSLLILLGISLFMSIMKSKFIWDSISLLSFIQFPWRWMSVGIIFLGLVSGSVTFFINKKHIRAIFSWVMILVIVLANFYFFRPEKYLENFDQYYYVNQEIIRTNMSGILEDYVPIQMADKFEPVHELIDSEKYDADDYELILNRTHEKLIATNFPEDQELNLNLAHYPGWTAEVDGKIVDYDIAEVGLINVSVPAGSHLVAIKFGATPVRFWSDMISLLSVITIAGFTAFKSEKNRSTKHD